jgi:hypothetical protein
MSFVASAFESPDPNRKKATANAPMMTRKVTSAPPSQRPGSYGLDQPIP